MATLKPGLLTTRQHAKKSVKSVRKEKIDNSLITVTFCTNIHSPHRVNPNDTGDYLTVPVVLPPSQTVIYLVKYLSVYPNGLKFVVLSEVSYS